MPDSFETYNGRWSAIWDKGLQPGQGFDKGGPSRVLTTLLERGELVVRGKRTLVPGCGRGYDVVELARYGATPAVGLELYQPAVAAAVSYRDKQGNLGENASQAQFLQADFLHWSDAAPFDVGYDYTFLCALHPDARRAWAAAWARLLAPGGELVTLMFPVDPGRQEAGPPWPVTPQLYEQLLLPAGFERTLLHEVPAELSHQGRQGREYLARWTRL